MTLPKVTALSTPTSPKVWASTAGTFLASLVVSVGLALQADPTALGGLPKPLLFLVVTILPTVVTFAAGYAQRDPLRAAGAVVVQQATPELVPVDELNDQAEAYVGRHDDGTGI